jgi:hypothetical protein
MIRCCRLFEGRQPDEPDMTSSLIQRVLDQRKTNGTTNNTMPQILQ